MRKLDENSIKKKGTCFSLRNEPFWKSGEYVSLCDEFRALMSEDYANTGVCNYYTTDDAIDKSPLAMAFQVFQY